MPGLVSILIPAYNADKWIGETIRSALSQTWPRLEIIIVDDGSSDNTLDVARSYESERVKVLTQDNAGASAARNTALAWAQGDYIQWLDADDLLAPDKISQQLKEDDGSESNTLRSSSWGRFFLSTRHAKFRPDSLWMDLDPIEWILRKFNDNAFMTNTAWLVSRRLTELAGPWDERLSLDDDGEYACRLVARSQRVKFVRDAKCFYRVSNAGSLSTLRIDKALESQFLSMCLSMEDLRSLEESERTRQACVRFLDDTFDYFYPDHAELMAKANDIARSLGAEVSLPRRRLHHHYLVKLMGSGNAGRIEQRYKQWKVAVLKAWEKKPIFRG